MVKLYQTEIDDPKIVDMDPVQKRLMYNHWVADQNDQIELAKNHAYLLASFWNPEAVQQIIGGGGKHSSTEDEFEESLRIVKESNLQLPEPIKKRKRPVPRG